MDKAYALDSFALLAHLENEKRGEKVTRVLLAAQQTQHIKLYMSIINLGEVYYITMRERGEQKAEEIFALIMLLPIQIIEADIAATINASKLKSRYPVAYADCFAASLAISKGIKLMTGDPEFRKMENEVKIEWL